MAYGGERGLLALDTAAGDRRLAAGRGQLDARLRVGLDGPVDLVVQGIDPALDVGDGRSRLGLADARGEPDREGGGEPDGAERPAARSKATAR
jgi:hypothetical protein